MINPLNQNLGTFFNGEVYKMHNITYAFQVLVNELELRIVFVDFIECKCPQAFI